MDFSNIVSSQSIEVAFASALSYGLYVYYETGRFPPLKGLFLMALAGILIDKFAGSTIKNVTHQFGF